eukprot:8274081-Pyramimonas_sp.AAC.1
MLAIRTGHRKPVTVVAFRLLWIEHGETIPAGASDVTDMRRSSQAGAPSLWGPHSMLVIQAGLRKRVSFVTVRFLWAESGGRIEEVSGGSPLPLGSALY